jgi:hypothetical protein
MIGDVLVKIKDLVFLVDFVILDMNVGDGVQIILGRPFLATSSAFINMECGEIFLRVGDEEQTIREFKMIMTAYDHL